MQPDDLQDTKPRRLLELAMSERRIQGARDLLRKALRSCDESQDSHAPGTMLLRAEIFAAMAVEEFDQKQRRRLWRRALTSVRHCGQAGRTAEAAVVEGFVSVDCVQDLIQGLADGERQAILRAARESLDDAIAGVTDRVLRAELLARKSSVLRHAAQFSPSMTERAGRLREAVRCARLGSVQGINESTQLEVGLAEWALARHETSDADYAERLRTAERELLHPILRTAEVAHLALSRFYRLAFQPLKACLEFPADPGSSPRYRRVIRDSYVLAEAAVNLWLGSFPEAIVLEQTQRARANLEAALAAGYRTARNVVDLAFVVAILDGAVEGETALGDLVGGSSIDWNALVRVASSDTDHGMASAGLLIGIEDSAIWTKLGTFAFHFLHDTRLAEAFYRAAVRSGPAEAVGLTNLARLLIRSEGKGAKDEAGRLLQRAASSADRRFTWWRAIRAELDAVSGPADRVVRLAQPSRPGSEYGPAKNRAGLKLRMVAAEGMAPQERGYELERLVFEMAGLTFGVAVGSYRFERHAGSRHSQVDAYFEHGANKYRVECKWTGAKADASDIILFEEKVDVAGVGGLFVSMAGFTDAAVAKAAELRKEKAILLMDGQEVRAVFNLERNLDEVLSEKRLFLDWSSEPYHRVATVQARSAASPANGDAPAPDGRPKGD